jgi:Xaa-Pro aminopeptidase
LTREELRWWDEYHATVLEIVGPQLEGEAKAWLEGVCAPFSKPL